MKSRISNTADTFNIGRTKLAKLSVSGKSLKLYLNLDIDEVESRLKCKDASETKAYEEVPVFLRIRSLRAMKNARYLIGKLAERFDLQVNPKFEKVDAMALIEEELE
jgi:predicted transport protein